MNKSLPQNLSDTLPKTTTVDGSEYFYEKEAEYYGFTPFQFLDIVGEIVVRSVFTMFDGLNAHDNKKDKDCASNKLTQLLGSKGKTEQGLASWCACVEGRFGRNYELFEAYVIRNVLILPDSFVPPHMRGIFNDEHGDDHSSTDSKNATDDAKHGNLSMGEKKNQSVNDLLAQVAKERALQHKLALQKRSIEAQAVLVEKMESLFALLKTSDSTSCQETIVELSETFISQMETLKKVVLRTLELASTLGDDGHDGNSASIQWKTPLINEEADEDTYKAEYLECLDVAPSTDFL